MNNLCVITARGGSKRIPHKNIVKVGGLPLIAWSIQAARDSEIFSHVLVSTDDEKIAEVSRKHEADVPFLREGASDDISTASDAALVAVQQAEAHWGISYDNVALLMPTCPLRNGELIKKQFDFFKKSKSNFVMSCADFGPFKPWWACELDRENKPRYLNPEALKKRSQDLPKVVAPSGAIWIANRDSLMKEKSYYGEGHCFFPIPWIAAIDIDLPGDILLIEALQKSENLQHLIESC